MKKLIFMAIALLALGFVACKPTEKNYRAAYERTMARDSARTPFEETIYGRYRRDVKTIPMVNGTDTVDVHLTRVYLTPGDGVMREYLKKYCVVIAEFKQLLNAQSIRDRFKEAGYTHAFIVQTPEPYYYVVAASYPDLNDANTLIAHLSHDTPVTLRKPCPYILVPSQLR